MRTSASFNYESQNSYNIRLRTTDSGNLTYEKAFTISINDVNDQPVLTPIGTQSIDEDIPDYITLSGTISYY